MKLKFNKGNWTGQEIEIEVLETQAGYEFRLYDMVIRVELTTHPDPMVGDMADVLVNGRKEFFGFKDGGYWVMHSREADMSREDRHPAVAAAQLICNLY